MLNQPKAPAGGPFSFSAQAGAPMPNDPPFDPNNTWWPNPGWPRFGPPGGPANPSYWADPFINPNPFAPAAPAPFSAAQLGAMAWHPPIFPGNWTSLPPSTFPALGLSPPMPSAASPWPKPQSPFPPPAPLSSPDTFSDDRPSPFVSQSSIDNIGGLFSRDPSIPYGLFPYPFDTDPGPPSRFGSGPSSSGGPAASAPTPETPGAFPPPGWPPPESFLPPFPPIPNPFVASPAPDSKGQSDSTPGAVASLELNPSRVAESFQIPSAAAPSATSDDIPAQFNTQDSQDFTRLGHPGAGKEGVQLACLEDGCVAEALVLLEAIELARLGYKVYQDYTGRKFLAGPYGKLSGKLPSGWQAHHLNQNGIYGNIIPRNEGFSVAMPGNVLTEPGTPHHIFHRSLDQFLDQYREGRSLQYETPTNAEYGEAARRALIASGLSPAQALDLTAQAAAQRAAYGLSESAKIPRLPRAVWPGRRD
jgi:hypothetical protein